MYGASLRTPSRWPDTISISGAGSQEWQKKSCQWSTPYGHRQDSAFRPKKICVRYAGWTPANEATILGAQWSARKIGSPVIA